MRWNWGIIAVLGWLISYNGCKRSIQAELPIPEDKFVKFYASMLILGNDTSSTASDPIKLKQKVDSLYHHYGVDSTLVRKNIAAYSSQPERWQEFFIKVVNRINETGVPARRKFFQ